MFVLFLLFLQVAVWVLRRYAVKSEILKRILTACSIALLVVWTVREGIDAFKSVNILILISSVLLSYVMYIVSLFIVGTKFSAQNLLPYDCFRAKGKLFTAFRHESIRNIFSSSYEEFLYRWFLQNALYELTHNVIISVSVTVTVFFAIHIKKQNAIVHLIDIFVFSFVITIWFYYTVNPLYSIIVHIIRNQLVICRKFTDYKSDYDRKNKYLKILHERKIRKNES